MPEKWKRLKGDECPPGTGWRRGGLRDPRAEAGGKSTAVGEPSHSGILWRRTRGGHWRPYGGRYLRVRWVGKRVSPFHSARTPPSPRVSNAVLRPVPVDLQSHPDRMPATRLHDPTQGPGHRPHVRGNRWLQRQLSPNRLFRRAAVSFARGSHAAEGTRESSLYGMYYQI